MFGFMGAGPDPKTMTCDAIIKGYKLNQQLAKERSGKHAKNSELRVKELLPYYQQCTAKQAAKPVEEQAQEIQAIYDKIYGDSSTALTPANTYAVQGASAGIDFKSVLVVVGVGIGLLLWLGTRKGTAAAPALKKLPLKKRGSK